MRQILILYFLLIPNILFSQTENPPPPSSNIVIEGYLVPVTIALGVISLVLSFVFGALTNTGKFLAEVLYDRIRGMKDKKTEDLIKLLHDGYLSKKSKTRLTDELYEAIKNWKLSLKPIEFSTEQTILFSKIDSQKYYVKSLLSGPYVTNCPGNLNNILDDNRPIYISSINDEEEILNGIDDLKFIVENKIKSIIDNNTVDYQLIRSRKTILANENRTININIWIQAPNIIIAKKEQLDLLYSKLDSFLRSKFDFDKLIIELYLSNDLIEECRREVINDIGDTLTIETPRPPASLYAYYRNNILLEYANGKKLGNYNDDQFIASKEFESILNLRYTNKQLDNIATWSLIQVVGDEYTGKSKTITKIVEYLHSNVSIISLHITPNLYNSINTLLDNIINSDLGDFHQSIINILLDPSKFLISNAHIDKYSRRAFKDSLKKKLEKDRMVLVFVFSDSNYYSDYPEKIQALIQRLNWNVKIILATNSSHNINVVDRRKLIQSKYFDLEQTKNIVKEEVGHEEINSLIDEVFSSNWIINQPHFSLQHIYLINKFIDKNQYDDENIILKSINEGIIIGNAFDKNYLIPESILNDKLKFNLDPFSWKTINIHGAPGSGKSELGKYLLNKISSNYKTLCIDFGELALQKENIQKLDVQNQRLDFFISLEKILFDKDNKLFDEEIYLNNECNELFHKIYYLLEKQIILFIDDFYTYDKSLIDKVTTLRTKNNWNVNIITIGRLPIENIQSEDKSKIYTISCTTWNKNDAFKILSSWLPPEKSSMVKRALDIQWLEKENDFSIYLMKVIKEHLETIESTGISVALSKQIKDILRPIHNDLTNESINSEYSYQEKNDIINSIIFDEKYTDLEIIRYEIKNQLNKKRDKFTINQLIDDIGTMSWVGRYQENDKRITIENLQKWSSLEEVKRRPMLFIDSSIKANIFKKKHEVFDYTSWENTLIADGCLAIKLGNDVLKRREPDSVIIKNLKILFESRSINIIKLALDEQIIKNIIVIIVQQSIPDFSIIKELLSDQILIRARNTDSIVGITDPIITNISRLEETKIDYQILAEILAKLSEYDKNLHDQLNQWQLNDDLVGKIALSVYANKFFDDNNFFIHSDNLNIDKKNSTQIACKTWSIVSLQIILQRFSVLHNSIYEEEDTRIQIMVELWNDYLDLKSARDLENTISFLIEYLIKANKIEIYYKPFFKLVFEKLKIKKASANILNKKWLEKTLYTDITTLHNHSKDNQLLDSNNTIGEIIKWLIYFNYPELFISKTDLDIDWHIIEDYAIPAKYFKSELIFRIIDLIPDNGKFELASIDEITKVGQIEGSNQINDYYELTRDRLVNRSNPFKYNLQSYRGEDNKLTFRPTDFTIWNGKKIKPPYWINSDFIDQKVMTTIRICWRPKFKIAAD